MLLKRIFLCFSLFALPLQADNYETPIDLPYVDREMTMAGFWISQHPSPDTVIMSPEAITAFNLINHQPNLKNIFDPLTPFNPTVNIFDLLTTFDPTAFAAFERHNLQCISTNQFVTISGELASQQFFDKMSQTMNLDDAGNAIQPTYGMIVHDANERLLPTNVGLYYHEDGEPYKTLGLFDQLQDSALDIGTPVVVFHVSSDQQWYFIVTETCKGWVAASDVALGNEEQVRIFSDMTSPVVAIQPHADLFLNTKKHNTMTVSAWE